MFLPTCIGFLVSLLIVHCYSLSVLQKPLQPQRQDCPLGESLSISIPVDHFNSVDTRTYSNRFWVNATFYRGGGPVFFYDAGERGVSACSMFLPAHPIMYLAKKFNGLAILWEHRFYGDSVPLQLDVNATLADQQGAYRYLDSEQALEDAVFLATHFKPPGLRDFWDILEPGEVPWIWVGASYPGQRAAMIRARNPGVFWASWSSSAPVQVVMEFPEYYLHISQQLPSKCRGVLQAVAHYVDRIMQEGSLLQQWKLKWAIARRWPSDRTLSDRVSFAIFDTGFGVASHLMQIVAWDWQWYGMKGQMNVTCAKIQQADPEDGIDVQTSLTAVLDAIESNDKDSSGYGKEPFPMDRQSWQYQVCTEFPYFRTSAPESALNILSLFLTAEGIWDDCARRFPWLHSPPDVATPLAYAGWNRSVGNVMWTTGMQDPWHGLSMAPTGSLVAGAPVHRHVTQQVPACARSLDDGEVFGLVLEHGRHCSDLQAGTDDARRAQELFQQALEVWLPCHRAGIA